MMDGIHHGWGMGLGWIIGFIVLVVIIWLIVRVANQKRNPNKPNN